MATWLEEQVVPADLMDLVDPIDQVVQMGPMVHEVLLDQGDRDLEDLADTARVELVGLEALGQAIMVHLQ